MEFDINNYKLAIFDYDGTVLDSMVMWRNLTSNFIKSKGVIDLSINKAVFKLTTVEAITLIRDKYFKDESLDSVKKEYKEFLKNEYVKQLLVPNAVSLVKEYKKKGIKCALLSATDKSLLELSLRLQNEENLFDAIYSASDLGMSKVTGEPYLYVSTDLGYSVKDTIVFEDAYHAILGAKSKGFECVGVYDLSQEMYTKEIKDITIDYMDIKNNG